MSNSLNFLAFAWLLATAITAAAHPEADYLADAFHPQKSTPVHELPGELFALQLIAVSSREQIENYAEQHDLYDLVAVPIQQHGKRLYVLIAGFYQHEQDARRALELLPQEVRTQSPWVRQLAGLQALMSSNDADIYAASD